jgi:hypothetical protein
MNKRLTKLQESFELGAVIMACGSGMVFVACVAFSAFSIIIL